MDAVQLKLDEKGRGRFYIMDENEQVAEMEISINSTDIIAYHTEVSSKYEGKGLAKQLLSSLVGHAREHGLKIIPLCPYVHMQFKRHPEEYGDVWNKRQGRNG